MTGLLSRLAERARGTRDAVRPLRDFRFPPRPRAAAAEEEERGAPPRRRGAPTVAEAPPEAGPHRSAPQPPPGDAAARATRPPRVADGTPPPEVSVQPVLSRPAALSAAERAAADATRIAAADGPEAVPLAATPPPPAAPIVPQQRWHRPQPAVPLEADPALRPPCPQHPAATPAPPAITIEIGRVEVVAPHRTAPQRASTQPDGPRLTTLADHLARRSGR
jgi:hypothetical protein